MVYGHFFSIFTPMSLHDKIQAEVLRLEGPIVVFGAGGFI
ncbi:MAG: hypothetical protein RLZZ367_1258, partial [Bacteroidota bacterium]